MTTRFLLLGASNLAISFPRLQHSLMRSTSSGVEIWGAFGHGRSYGLPTRVLGRGLPSIAECGLWSALEARPSAQRLHALVADVGNDLLFGPSVETIAGWVDACVGRLSARSARVAILGLPLPSIESLPPARFLFFRTLLYPSCKKPWQQIRDEARDLDAALRDIAQRHGASFLEPSSEWYGLDPVHIRPRAQEAAWREILGGGLAPSMAPDMNLTPGWRRRFQLWALPPQERTLWGGHRHTSQPVWEDENGKVFLY